MRNHHAAFDLSQLSPKVFYCGFLLLWLIASAPLLFASQPPLADYPNHLARVHILLDPANLDLTRYYEILHAIQPNLAFDIAVYLLAKFLPLSVAGKVFIAMTLALAVLGPAWLYYVLTGRYSAWPFLGFLFVYNRIFAWGFIGYLFALGLVFAAVALWIASRRHFGPMAFLTRAFIAVLVFVCHLYAFGVLGLLVLLFTITNLIDEWKTKTIRVALWNAMKEMLPLAVPIALFILSSPLSKKGSQIVYGPFIGKLTALLGPVVSQTPRFDMMCLAGIAILLTVLLARRQLSFQRYGLLILAVLSITHLLMPDKLFSSYGADKRLPIAIAFALIALTDLKADRKTANAIFGICFALFIARVAVYSAHWASFDAIHAEYMQANTHITPGSKLVYVVGTENPSGLPALPLTEHAGWSVIDKNVFWPGLFANPVHHGQSIAFRPLAVSMTVSADFQKVPLKSLSAFMEGKNKAGQEFNAHIAPCFDHVLVGMEKPVAFTPAPDWTLLYSSEHVRLYRTGGTAKSCALNSMQS